MKVVKYDDHIAQVWYNTPDIQTIMDITERELHPYGLYLGVTCRPDSRKPNESWAGFYYDGDEEFNIIDKAFSNVKD